MIIIKGKDESAIVARIESELKGEEIDIFQADDTEYSMEQVLAFLGYNAKQARVYIGRLERNSRRIDEDIRATNKLLEPVSMYFSYLCQETLPDGMLTLHQRQEKSRRERYQEVDDKRQAVRDRLREEGLKRSLEEQQEISQTLKDEGLNPETD